MFAFTCQRFAVLTSNGYASGSTRPNRGKGTKETERERGEGVPVRSLNNENHAVTTSPHNPWERAFQSKPLKTGGEGVITQRTERAAATEDDRGNLETGFTMIDSNHSCSSGVREVRKIEYRARRGVVGTGPTPVATSHRRGAVTTTQTTRNACGFVGVR
jgi:hypothetical protein